MSAQSRREFLKHSSAGVAGSLAFSAASLTANSALAGETNDKIVVALVGCGGRGSGVIQGFAEEANCEVAAMCDPDEGRAGALADQIGKNHKRPQVETDLRKALDRPDIDAVVVATPDHWHGPATLLALAAGKHVYVEKPCSHNFREGRLMVDAAREQNRIVQHGTQSRNMRTIVGAIQLLREGVIGDVLVSKAWNVQRRGNIGHAQPGDPPKGLDYDLWVGPAEYVPYQSNRLHYNWHWWYNFGTGDMGNDGVHELDYARWGLGVETHPSRISGLGTKLYFNDDQQFPDTQQVVFEYPGEGSVGQRKLLIWEMRIWSRNYPYNIDNGVEFYGTQGRMLLSKRNVLEILDDSNQPIKPKLKNELPELKSHHVDFLQAIRTGKKPNADIEIGFLSTALCHLGNISSRVGRTLNFDPHQEQVLGDEEANKLLTRTYREGHWAVPKGV